MRFNKQIAVILVLTSLLISAIGAALFLFYENENTKKANAQQLTVYIAKQDIKKDALISERDIVKTVIAKKYLLVKPLLKKEIINKFATSRIYKNEMFRKEKLISKIGPKVVMILPFKYNSYNAAFNLFENPNYSIIKGDLLNIVSVYPKSKDKKNMNYNVKYVAKQVQVLGFLEKGKVVEKAFRKIKKKVKTKGKKKKTPTYELVKVFANEVVLDISDKIILSMIDDYNKGKQLWMVKTNEAKVVIKKPLPKPIFIPQKVHKKAIKPKVKKIIKKKVKKVYAYKMYLPKDTVKTRSAVIEYEDSTIADVTQKVTIKSTLIQQCIAQNKVLIGTSTKVMLRTIPSLRGRIK
ncbi:MAG: hypothetical protein HRT43_13605, partial [Campylobacteraceae bacterium]|nr:hypothetical protein [Campylobacteraceae bacterium]